MKFVKKTASTYFKIIPKDETEESFYMEYKLEGTVEENQPFRIIDNEKTTALIVQEIRKSLSTFLSDCDIIRISKEEYEENTEPDNEEIIGLEDEYPEEED